MTTAAEQTQAETTGTAYCAGCLTDRMGVRVVEAGNFVRPTRVPLCGGCRERRDDRSRRRGFKSYADERAQRCRSLAA